MVSSKVLEETDCSDKEDNGNENFVDGMPMPKSSLSPAADVFQSHLAERWQACTTGIPLDPRYGEAPTISDFQMLLGFGGNLFQITFFSTALTVKRV